MAEFAGRARTPAPARELVRTDRPRTRSHGSGRRWTVQRGDSRPTGGESRHRQNPRQPSHGQAGRADRAQLVVFTYETNLVRPGWLG